jgi:hypothetical protein
MRAITTIVHFSVPKENMDAVLAVWRKIRVIKSSQPGALDGVFHRTLIIKLP